MNLKKNDFYGIKKSITRLIVVFLFLNLAACSNEDMNDLEQYIKSVKVKPRGTIQPLPEIKIVEPFIFNPEGLRDPFRAIVKRVSDKVPDFGLGIGIRPDVTRRKEELEAYSLDSLRMVGTLVMDKGLWALVKANDGTIHRVKKGNHMGSNYGEIIRILDDRIELMEIVPDKPGEWREQQASLALSE